MMAQDKGCRTPLWSESRSRPYGLSEEQVLRCLDKPAPGFGGKTPVLTGRVREPTPGESVTALQTRRRAIKAQGAARSRLRANLATPMARRRDATRRDGADVALGFVAPHLLGFTQLLSSLRALNDIRSVAVTD